MKRLLIPFLALALCPPAVAHRNDAEILAWATAAEAIGEIRALCIVYDKGLITFKVPARIIASRFTSKDRTVYEKFLMHSIALVLEGGRVKNGD